MCDITQSYTMYGGQRPFGVSFLFAGWDPAYGFQLYNCDPSGNYVGWKAIAVGNNNQMARDVLKKEYKEDCTYKEALVLGAEVLSKAMDIQTLTKEKMEFAVLQRIDGKVVYQSLTPDETDALLKKVEEKQAAAEAAKQ